MEITKNVLNAILFLTPPPPPETGGILGGRNGVIEQCVFDSGSSASNGYDIYAPNTEYINQCIKSWADQGITFYGMFHSHFPGGTELSNGDKRYIETIFQALPSDIQFLYFPIVLPQQTIIVYRANRRKKATEIVRDKIEII